ncbi:MAG: hypothetical protein HY549_00735 [Elusimicrobia bacterium]|nr:hypothetical protein [Elusimicrobiota bacterium]
MEHRCLSPWKGAVVGGLIAFIWSAVSWMALPFHDKTIHTFADAAPVVNALEGGAPSSGIYILMNDPKGQTAPTDPFLFISYHKAGWGSMGSSMALGLLIQMIGAFFWTWILGKIPGLTLKDAALYGCFFGICIGALGSLPNWVWWKFPFGFVALYVVDSVIAWSLASMAISHCYASACALPKAG